jgi:phosphate-selective porin OprO/OprP
MRTIASLKRTCLTRLSAVCITGLLWAGAASAQPLPGAPGLPARPQAPALPDQVPAAGEPPAAAAEQPAGKAAPGGADDVRAIVKEELKKEEERKKEAEKKKKEEEDRKKEEEKRRKEEEGYVVGSDNKLSGLWTPNGLVFQTENQDYQMHFGGRFNFDQVWWKQPAYLKGPAPGNGGLPNSKPGDGVGVLDDGFFLRRVRLKMNGQLSEVIEYDTEFDFENLNRMAFDEMFVGVKDIPLIGTVRIGQHKVPMGLESYSSSRYLVFLERSSLFDAFWQEFAPGIFFSNSFFDQHMTYALMFHKIEVFQPFNGSSFGDGEYAATGRLSFLPVWANEGRCYQHLAASYQWRAGNLGREYGGTGNAFADTQRVVIFRDRPELRDAVGTGGDTEGDSARFVSTGFFLADSVHTVGAEYLGVWGPLSVQAEGTFAVPEGNVRSVYPASQFGTPRGNPVFWGSYAQVSYFLTGESRPYDRRFGVYTRVRPNENFFLVQDEDGRTHFGLGAWELAYRYSYLNLNGNGITGGILGEHTVGLNWYLSSVCKMQFNYINANRWVSNTPARSGTIQGIGLRTVVDF